MSMFAFLSWDLLATFTGAVGLTCIIVQLLKLPLDKVWKIPTRYLVFVICFAIMLAAQWFTVGTLTVETVAITAVNAVLGTLASMSLYEQVIELPESKKLLTAFQYMKGQTAPDTEAAEAAQKAAAESVKAHDREAETAQTGTEGDQDDDEDEPEK